MSEKIYTESQIRKAVEQWVVEYQTTPEEEKATEYGELEPKACAEYLLSLLESMK